MRWWKPIAFILRSINPGYKINTGGGMPQKADSSKPSCPGLKADKQNQDEKE